MPEHRSPAVEAIIREAERKAAGHPDPVAALVMFIKVVIGSEADPYLLAGALLEGIAITIAERIPKERRVETAVASIDTLRERLRAHGAI